MPTYIDNGYLRHNDVPVLVRGDIDDSGPYLFFGMLRWAREQLQAGDQVRLLPDGQVAKAEPEARPKMIAVYDCVAGAAVGIEVRFYQ